MKLIWYFEMTLNKNTPENGQVTVEENLGKALGSEPSQSRNENSDVTSEVPEEIITTACGLKVEETEEAWQDY